MFLRALSSWNVNNNLYVSKYLIKNSISKWCCQFCIQCLFYKDSLYIICLKLLVFLSDLLSTRKNYQYCHIKIYHAKKSIKLFSISYCSALLLYEYISFLIKPSYIIMIESKDCNHGIFYHKTVFLIILETYHKEKIIMCLLKHCSQIRILTSLFPLFFLRS